MMKQLLFSLLCFSLFYGCAIADIPTKRVLFDTDMGPDYDDVGALTVLHALADSGEVEILATASSNLYKNSVPCIEVINSYFNRSDLPTAKPQSGIDLVDKRFINDYWAEKLPLKYPHKTKASADAPDAVSLYRRLLSSQPDSGVTIITVGFFTNLSALLLSEKDDFSELSGKELVRKKVKMVVSMGGKFPEGREFNVFADSVASRIVFDEWPTPILLCGYEIGRDIYTGLRLTNSNLKNSPIKDVYDICLQTDTKGRSSWDQITVLVGVRGYEPYFEMVKGRMIVNSDGSNRWESDVEGSHGYLIPKITKKGLTDIIEELMMHQPCN